MTNNQNNLPAQTTDAAPPPRPKAPLIAGNKPTAIVPVDFDGAYRIANVVVQARMAPKTLDTVEKAMVAILHGLEVGLTPMNALQSIAVINGRPTIWGDGAIGLIRASGLLEWMRESLSEVDGVLTATCTLKRKGDPEPAVGTFSLADARTAGLLTKDGPWQTYPKRMLQARARAWPLRDTFADVLKGLHIREEVEDMTRNEVAPVVPPIPEDQKPQIEQQTAEAEPEEIIIPSATEPEPEQAKPTFTDDERDWLNGLGGAFSGCEDSESLVTEYERLMLPWREKVSDAAWDAAESLYAEHQERIG